MNLKPGQSRELSRIGTTRVTVERSGDGKVIRYVRHTPSGFVVFKTCAA
jgi:hypothetical protein